VGGVIYPCLRRVKLNKIKNGLLWRISLSGFAIIVAVLSLVEFLNNKNYINLIFSMAWSLLAISYFLKPPVFNWNNKLPEVKYVSAPYVIGAPAIAISCSMVGSALLLAAVFLKFSNTI
jgi:hypothetical protein